MKKISLINISVLQDPDGGASQAQLEQSELSQASAATIARIRNYPTREEVELWATGRDYGALEPCSPPAGRGLEQGVEGGPTVGFTGEGGGGADGGRARGGGMEGQNRPGMSARRALQQENAGNGHGGGDSPMRDSDGEEPGAARLVRKRVCTRVTRTWEEVGRWATGQDSGAESVEAAVLAAAEQQCPETWARRSSSSDLGPWKLSSEYTKDGGLGTVQLYKCPLLHRCGCKCMLRVSRYPRLVVMDVHGKHQHAEDRSKGLKLKEVAAIVEGVRADPFLRPAQVLRRLADKGAGQLQHERLLRRGLYLASKARREALAEMFTRRKPAQSAAASFGNSKGTSVVSPSASALHENREAAVFEEVGEEGGEEVADISSERWLEFEDSSLDPGMEQAACGAGCFPGCMQEDTQRAQSDPTRVKAEPVDSEVECKVARPCLTAPRPSPALSLALGTLIRGPRMGYEFDALPDKDARRHKLRRRLLTGNGDGSGAPATYPGASAGGMACKLEGA